MEERNFCSTTFHQNEDFWCFAIQLFIKMKISGNFYSLVFSNENPLCVISSWGGGLPGFSTNLSTFLQPSFLDNDPPQLLPPVRPPLPRSSPPLPPSSPPPPTREIVPVISKPLGVPPESLLPLKDCPNPHYCVGGRNHTYFLPPGTERDLPTREQVEWSTLR